MRNFLLVPIVLLLAITAQAQFNNNWIKYNKTYYKFKVAKDGLYRINQATLAAAGLGNVSAQDFQLWRNGEEVTIFTSISQGIFGVNDYIEFWGLMNDGKRDRELYRNPDFQLNNKFSLETDTATYFLTTNSGQPNLRYSLNANPVQNNVLPPDDYFMRTVEANFKNTINQGFANNSFTTYIYSSSYDIGEGWTTKDISPGAPLKNTFNNLNVFAGGPANSVKLTVSAAGSAPNTRDLVVNFFNTNVLQAPMNFFSYRKDTVNNLPLALLQNNNSLDVYVNGNSQIGTDRIVVGTITVTYPAIFNFNNLSNFYFELAPDGNGNFLVIDNFNNNGVAPILLDFSSQARYIGDISVPGKIRFALPPSDNANRKFMLISQDPGNINAVNTLTAKSFINYGDAANQGDYIIISNDALFNNGNNVDYVEQYRQYRSSIAGGSYNAKIINIKELTDQFGFGIKNHPAAIRDFIRYAKQNFVSAPKYVFLIGRAVNYIDYRLNESNPASDKLNLVPTFGWPASDLLLSTNPGEYVPLVPIGRLGAINGNEVGIYLEKMKQYEQAQQNPNQTIADKAWMKNFMHISGGKDDIETAGFLSDLNNYAKIASDTFYGANVQTFAKSSTAEIEQQSSQKITELFNEGLSFVQYFGHSSGEVFAFSLNEPNDYNNLGKYPFFNVSGCTAGNYYTLNAARLNGDMSLSEKYIINNQKGSIGFLASTHFGIQAYLNLYNKNLYTNISKTMYGNTIGNQIKQVLQTLGGNPQLIDYFTRIHLEELALHGDPGLKINASAKPDYVIESQLVKLSPNIISVADNKFDISIKMMNIGTATKDSIRVTVKQQLPDNSMRVLYNQKQLAMPYIDSLHLTAQINPITDKGVNKLIITLDADNAVDELSEMNNVLERSFTIFEDELRPTYPYNYSIITQSNFTYSASTANPLGGQRQYVMELDTTALFNSPLKKTYNANGTGGIVQFKPTNFIYIDGTVYYWRVAIVPINNNNYIWNNASFVYLPSSSEGFNQSHYYQHTASPLFNLNLGADRLWRFDTATVNVKIKNGVFPTAANLAQDFQVVINGAAYIESACNVNRIIFNVFKPSNFEALRNVDQGPGLYGSDPFCGPSRKWNFQYTTSSQASRIAAVNFMEQIIPNGYYVTVRFTASSNINGNTYADAWKADQAILGQGKSLYHSLKNAGFTDIDLFDNPKAFNFIYKKGSNSFTPIWQFSEGINDKIELDAICPITRDSGSISSPLFGPAKSWDQFHFKGNPSENISTDSINFKIIGVTANGNESILYNLDSTNHDVDISSINATQYPFLKLQMLNRDTVNATPYQLKHWRVNYTPVAEGSVAPNILFNMKDTVEQGEVINFQLAFKNISPIAFDSLLKVNFIITDRNNIPKPINIPKRKALVSGDTLIISYAIDTKDLPGNNTLFIDVNPNNDQPEQFHFNNVLYKDFFVKPDNYNPLLDVTFDGVHILNKDIVAAAPHILIKLKDESKFLALDDTASLKVQIKYPDETLHDYQFGDTMQFIPANLNAGENTATINLKPYFAKDGEYELIISGKDKAGNKAGNLEYRIVFTVISKPMISNLLNYPNPFTTSTAFVFTVTGKEIPQNMRIQILTITGKVVKEITKNELGPIHIGRNITEYKWDGTDMYGQKLANGVYLYRVLTNLNGKSLDRYKADGDNTDQYFNKGYGKMVIIR